MNPLSIAQNLAKISCWLWCHSSDGAEERMQQQHKLQLSCSRLDGILCIQKTSLWVPRSVLVCFTTQYTLATAWCLTSQTRFFFFVSCFWLCIFSWFITVIPVFSQYMPLQLFSFSVMTGELLPLYRTCEIS